MPPPLRRRKRNKNCFSLLCREKILLIKSLNEHFKKLLLLLHLTFLAFKSLLEKALLPFVHQTYVPTKHKQEVLVCLTAKVSPTPAAAPGWCSVTLGSCLVPTEKRCDLGKSVTILFGGIIRNFTIKLKATLKKKGCRNKWLSEDNIPLSENPCSVPQTHIKRLTIALNSISRDLTPLAFVRTWTQSTHEHTQAHTHF